MKIFLIDDLTEKEFHAGYKARIDVNNILLKNFEDSEVFSFYRYKIPSFGTKFKIVQYIRLRLLFRSNQFNFLNFLKKVKADDVVVIPFPFEYQWFVLVTSYIFRQLKKLQKTKNVKIVYVIHDLNCIRYPEIINEESEVPLMELPDAIIVHNPTMIEWLVSRGVSSKKLINLQVFDYISPIPKVFSSTESPVIRKVIFGGNLSPAKSKFLYDWNPKYNVELYGLGLGQVDGLITYKGLFDPNEPCIDSSGISFGLVWDGLSSERLEGVGSYLRYNNPHKISLYFSQDLPVIVSSESALAPFVLENNLGFTVNGLNDIKDKLENIQYEDYLVIKNNVKVIGEKMRKGGFMKEALTKSIELFN